MAIQKDGNFKVHNETREVRASGKPFLRTETNPIGDLSVTLNTSIDDVNDSITTYPKCSYFNTAASALVKTGAGQAYGIFVNSYTATATVKLWDNPTAAITVLTDTLIIDRVGLYPLVGATFGTALYCTIATAAANITILYR